MVEMPRHFSFHAKIAKDRKGRKEGEGFIWLRRSPKARRA